MISHRSYNLKTQNKIYHAPNPVLQQIFIANIPVCSKLVDIIISLSLLLFEKNATGFQL
jgi:hypothetical protein